MDEMRYKVENEKDREEIKKMKKDNEITEDDQKNGETKIQKITDDYTKKIDSIAEAKTEEIMSV